MSFLNPFFLIGLLAVAIPIILHFINLRKPRQVAFSTITFFTELQKSTLKRLNIKRLLLLAVRSLALIFLAFALARPFLPAQLSGFGSERGPVLYGILIDNSPGMGQIDANGPYIDQAKEIAGQVISRTKSNDLFMIMPTHGEPAHSRPVSRQEASRLLDEVAVVNKGSYLVSNMKPILLQLSQKNIPGLMYWISHGQKTHIQSLEQLSLDMESFSKEFAPVRFVKIGDQPALNTAVTRVRQGNQIISKGKPFMVEVEVQNFGNSSVYNQYLTLDIEGRSIGEYQVDLEAGQSENFVFEVVAENSGDLKGVARLEGDTYTFDNQRFFSIEVPETKRILLVRDDTRGSDFQSYLSPVLQAATQTNTQIQFNSLTVNQLRGESLDEYEAVVLDGLTSIPDYIHGDLQRFVQDGRGLIVFPSENSNLNTYNQFLSQFGAGRFTGLRGDFGRFEHVARFQPLVEGHPILDEIFEKNEDDAIRATMPDVYYYWIYESGSNTRGNPIFRSNLNEPLLTEHRYGDGLLLVSSIGSNPGWSNFPTNPLFAPIYFRMALYAVSFEGSGMKEHILGRPFNWSHNFENLDIQIDLNNVTIRPEAAMTSAGVQINYSAMEWEPGWASISDGQQERNIAINQDVSESDFSAFNKGELEQEISNYLHLLEVVDTYRMSSGERNINVGSAGFASEIWNWFIVMALVLLLAECVITKKYKAERLS